jgi:hypothetical protein
MLWLARLRFAMMPEGREDRSGVRGPAAVAYVAMVRSETVT